MMMTTTLIQPTSLNHSLILCQKSPVDLCMPHSKLCMMHSRPMSFPTQQHQVVASMATSAWSSPWLNTMQLFLHPPNTSIPRSIHHSPIPIPMSLLVPQLTATKTITIICQHMEDKSLWQEWHNVQNSLRMLLNQAIEPIKLRSSWHCFVFALLLFTCCSARILFICILSCCKSMLKDLKEKFKLKIKGDGPLDYHVGCDYKLDQDNTLVAQP